jgi:N-glycosidase YbiA
MQTIFFQKTRDPYGELSNMYPCAIWFDNREWRSSEHLYQALKFDDFATQEKIRGIPSPMGAAIEGRSTSNKIKNNWVSQMEYVMSTALRAKFTQCQRPREVLLSTEDAWIVELSYKDDYWGSKPDMSGRNRLGHLQMQLRQEMAALGV